MTTEDRASTNHKSQLLVHTSLILTVGDLRQMLVQLGEELPDSLLISFDYGDNEVTADTVMLKKQGQMRLCIKRMKP